MEAENTSETYRYVRIPREIEEVLQSDERRAVPCAQYGKTVCRCVSVLRFSQAGGHGKAYIVRYDDFFGNTYDNAGETVGDILHSGLSIVYLLGYQRVSYYGTSYQLREHRDIEKVLAEAALRGSLVPPAVEGIRDILKSEE